MGCDWCCAPCKPKPPPPVSKGGRPYYDTEGEWLLPHSQSTSAWKDSACPFIPTNLSTLTPELKQKYAKRWEQQGQSEHASVASFALFIQKLLSVSAPPELILEATDCLREEISHAKMCYALASAYAGRSIDPGSYDTHTILVSADISEMLIATIKEGCIHETVSAFEAVQETENPEIDPVVKEILKQIAQEEAHHTAFAYKVVKWGIERELEKGNKDIYFLAQKTFETEISELEFSDCPRNVVESLKELKMLLFRSFEG